MNSRNRGGAHIHKRRLREVQDILGYRFHSPELLEQALTTPRAGRYNNDAMEFRGDKVLGHVGLNLIEERYGVAEPSESSRTSSLLVRNTTLAYLTLNLGLLKYINFGNIQEEIVKKSLADAFEAIIGAIDLDGGLGPVTEFCRRVFRSELELLRFVRPDELLIKGIMGTRQKVSFAIHPRTWGVTSRGKMKLMTYVSVVRINRLIVAQGEGVEMDSANNRACAHALLKLHPQLYPCKDPQLGRVLGLGEGGGN